MVVDTKIYLLHFSLLTILQIIVLFFILYSVTNTKKIILYLLSMVPIMILLIVSDLFNILTICITYFIFKRYKFDFFVLSSILFVQIICTITYYFCESILNFVEKVFSSEITSFYPISFWSNVFLLVIVIFLVKRYKIVDRLKKSNLISTSLFLYFFLVIRLTIFISNFFDILDTSIMVINFLLIVQAIFTVLAFLIISYNRRKKYNFQLLKKQLDVLKEYTKELEYDEQVNAKFKHDYKNLLLSLKGSAENDSSSELINTVSDLEQYSDNYFKKIEVDFRHCQNIKNDYLKSLIISKLSKAKQKEIACHFECEMVVDKMPIDQFDCVRMFGIVLDNAIEAAVETAHPRIDIMLYQDDNQLEFWVRNNYVANTIDLKSLRQANVSTKAGHSGLGLVNIEEISQKHPNILKTFSKKKDIFSVNIKILVN